MNAKTSTSEVKHRAAEALLSEQLSGIGKPISITDENDEFIALSHAFAELTGFSNDALVGHKFGNFVSTVGALPESCSEGKTVRVSNNKIFRLKKKDGTTFSAKAKTIPIQVQKGMEWWITNFVLMSSDKKFPVSEAENRRKLAELTKAGTGIVQGGLLQHSARDVLRRKLAGKWDGFARSINELADEVDYHNIDEKDFMGRNANDDLVLCFDDASTKQASDKTQVISRQLQAAILSDEFAHKLAPLELDEGILDTASKGKSIPLEMDLSGKQSDSASLSDLLSAKLVAAQKRMADQAKAIIPSLAESNNWRTTLFSSPRGESLPFGNVRYFGNELDFVKLDILPDDESAAVFFDIDLINLTKSYETLLGPIQKDQSLLIDVHFSTWATPAYLQQYQMMCARMGTDYAQHVTFNIRDIPERTNVKDIVQATQDLKRYCCSCAIENHPMTRTPIGGGVSFLVCPFDAVVAYCSSQERLKKRIKKLHEHNIKIIVKEVPEGDAIEALGAFDIDMTQQSAAKDDDDDYILL